MQRMYSIQCRAGKYPYMLIQAPSSSSSLFSPSNHIKLHKIRSDVIKKIVLNGKQLPSFNSLHDVLKLSNSRINQYRLMLTEATAQSKEGREDMEEDDDVTDISPTDSSAISYSRKIGSTNNAASFDSSNNGNTNNVAGNNLMSASYDHSGREKGRKVTSPPFQSFASSSDKANTSNFNNSSSSNKSHVSSITTVGIKKAPVDFLDDSSSLMEFTSLASPVLIPSHPPPGVFSSHLSNNNRNPRLASAPSSSIPSKDTSYDFFDEESIYRIVNKDTGEIHDLRDLDKMISMAKIVTTTPSAKSKGN